MKSVLFICFLSILLFVSSFAQNNIDPWNKLNYLVGKWKGEGEGKPGQGEGYFTFKYDLDKNILVRSSHSEYPKTDSRPATIHDDLMIIYCDALGTPNRAVYFDNEKHVINYSVACIEKSIIFTSDKINNVPTFRLSYNIIDQSTVNVKFELSQDGEKFLTYIEGRSKRVE